MDSNRLLIRDMTHNDLPAIIALENDLFSDPWPGSVFRDDINSPYDFPVVAQLDSRIVGYAVLTAEYGQGHLTNIAVARDYQRKSIAKKLLSFILKLAKELDLTQVSLEVRPSNKPAISLYEDFGFERFEVRKNYYRNPLDDCLVMRKDISGQ